MESTSKPTPPAAPPEWYYVEGEQQIGPVTPMQLRDLASQNKIARDTRVWKQGMPDWVPASQTGLSKFFPSTVPSPAPVPTRAPPPVPTAPIPSPYSSSRAATSAQPMASIGCLPLLGVMILCLIVILVIPAVFGNSAAWLFYLATCFGVLYDAHQVEARPDVVSHLGNLGPWGWFFACLLIWIVAFPCYLLARPHFVAAKSVSS